MAAQDYEQVTYNGPDGAQMGSSASELIAFHGATPTDQPAYVASVTTVFLEGSISASAIVGFSLGQYSALIGLVHGMKAILIEKGLMAAS